GREYGWRWRVAQSGMIGDSDASVQVGQPENFEIGRKPISDPKSEISDWTQAHPASIWGQSGKTTEDSRFSIRSAPPKKEAGRARTCVRVQRQNSLSHDLSVF